MKICQRGHKQTKENLYVRPNGKKQCNECIKLYREKNKERLNKLSTDWQRKNKQRVKEINKKHRDTDSFRNKHKLFMRGYYKKYIPQLQSQVLTHYGNGKMACVCCGIEGILFLTIDHVNGREQHEKKNTKYRGWLLKQYLKSHGYPEGYQTLCWNCNCARALNKGVCPHKATETIKETNAQ